MLQNAAQYHFLLRTIRHIEPAGDALRKYLLQLTALSGLNRALEGGAALASVSAARVTAAGLAGQREALKKVRFMQMEILYGGGRYVRADLLGALLLWRARKLRASSTLTFAYDGTPAAS